MNTGNTRIRVAVVESTPGHTKCVELSLMAGATVADALRAAAGTSDHVSVQQWANNVGIFGTHCDLQRELREGDRVELYRPLAIDAKTARRLRAKRAPLARGSSRVKD